MATATGRRWQELQEQLRGGRSRRATGGEGLFNVSANDIGQRSIFSKTPRINPSFNPNSPDASGMPYLDNTAAGRRLNVRNVQDIVEQARLLSAIKGQQDSELALANNESANRMAESDRSSKNRMAEDTNRINTTKGANIEQLTAAANATKQAHEATLQRLGMSQNPDADPEQAMATGEAILNAANVDAYNKSEATKPYLNELAASGAARTLAENERINRENAAKDPSYIKNSLDAGLAAERAKAISSIGPGGSIISGSQPGDNTLVNPSHVKTIKTMGPPTLDAKGNMILPGQPIETLNQAPPSIVPKINLQSFDPNTTPDLYATLPQAAPTSGVSKLQPAKVPTPTLQQATPTAVPATPAATPFDPNPINALLKQLPPANPFSGLPQFGSTPAPSIAAPSLTLSPPTPISNVSTNGVGLLNPSGFETNIRNTILPRAAAAIQELIRLGKLPGTVAPQNFPATNRFGF